MTWTNYVEILNKPSIDLILLSENHQGVFYVSNRQLESTAAHEASLFFKFSVPGKKKDKAKMVTSTKKKKKMNH